MGQVLARVLENLSWGKRDLSIVMLGLDAAGKTTILYRIKLGEKITVIPIIGFNVETIHYRNVKFTVWEVGSQDKIRCLWHHYFHNTQGLIFVVDSKDNERIMEARDELHKVANADELREVTVLVFANKQDLANTMSIEEMTDKLSLARLPQRDWHIQPCSAVTGEGLYEGLDWLSTSLRNA